MKKTYAHFFDQSFLAHIYLGYFDWDLISQFPEQSAQDKAVGDEACRDVVDFINRHLDDDKLESDGVLSQEYLDAVRRSKYPKLICPKNVGGGAYTNMNSFRILQSAMDRSIPAAFPMGSSNSFGIASLLSVVPDGEFKNYISRRVSEGILSGWADTEPVGAANVLPQTQAITKDGGRSFHITGDKCFIANGSVADVLIVSATVIQDGELPQSALFAVDTREAGFTVKRTHDFMGITGSPVAALSFDSVRVTSDQRLVSPYGHWRDTFMIEPTSALGRMLTVVSATSSISKKSLKYMAQFRMKREINGKPLGEYGKIQALIAKSTAEVFALDSVIQWSLVGSDGDNLPNRWWEQTATKNIVTLAASRLADRAISFMGASGYEKAAVYPTEKLYRDARGFRISGGVDFMIDLQAAQRWLKAFFYNDEFDRKKWMDQFEVKKRLNIDDSVLGPECTRILNRIRTDARDLGELIQQLISKHSYEELCKQQSLLILMNRVANEIFTIAATLARARKRAIDSETFAISIAEEYAAEGLLKINGFWEKIRLEVAMSGPVQQRRVSIGHYLDGHMLDFCL